MYEVMNDLNFVGFLPDYQIPKYKQIVNLVLDKVNSGKLNKGTQIPSINNLSEELFISRNTVEKAYRILKSRGIIESKKAIGYFISNKQITSPKRIMFFTNKFSNNKLRTYNAFTNGFKSDVFIDFYVYQHNSDLLVNRIKECICDYDYFVLIPHFKNKNGIHFNYNQDIIDALSQIPANKLLILDNKINELGDGISTVYQDFELDIYEALTHARESLLKYNKLVLVFPIETNNPYPQVIKFGFKKFCCEHHINFEVQEEKVKKDQIQSGKAYIVINEDDLVGIMDSAKTKGYHLGSDIGIISYNDSPLKKFLDISVLTTDFEKMGEKAQRIVLSNQMEIVKNDFIFINRKSI
jgi:DNA-binding transcriptional regulator YhcF (GntR family)